MGWLESIKDKANDEMNKAKDIGTDINTSLKSNLETDQIKLTRVGLDPYFIFSYLNFFLTLLMALGINLLIGVCCRV